MEKKVLIVYQISSVLEVFFNDFSCIELILGAVFLEAASVLFDRKNGRLGFRQSRCPKWNSGSKIDDSNRMEFQASQIHRRPLVVEIFKQNHSE